MALDDFSKHQQGIIKRYYENRSTILLQKLSEQVTELYLAEGKKRDRHWQSVATTLSKLGIPAARIEHVTKQKDPTLLAKLVQELQNAEPK